MMMTTTGLECHESGTVTRKEDPEINSIFYIDLNMKQILTNTQI